ncbi:MAG: hypothetical protein H7Z16_17670 [Pyrinomonadaceae bacterium]|nr:hypothetical protein [Pyrinomonadaceae bacterium]
MSVPKLRRIEERIDRARRVYEDTSGGVAMVSTLPPQLRTWEERDEYFKVIDDELNTVGRVEKADDAARLHDRAGEANYLLDLMVNDHRARTLAAINIIPETELISAPFIQNRFVDLAMHDFDPKVRRTAWLQLCHYHAKGEHHATAGGSDSHGNFGRERMRRLFNELMRERSPLGPRGSFVDSAHVREGQEKLVSELLTALARAEGDRKEVALTLSEIGGEEVTVFLADALRSEIEEDSPDEEYPIYLASALSNLGGADAVEGLLRAADEGAERVRLAALSGLESLATAGSTALLESPEPATIEGEEMRTAFVNLAERLSALIFASETPTYVRHKASELLDAVRISLRTIPVHA